MIQKQIVFDFFRYQILVKSNQLALFSPLNLTIEELRERKNDFLLSALINPDITFADSQNRELKHKIIASNNSVVAMKLGKSKTILIANEKFEDEEHVDFPSVYVAFNNNPEIQIIAISRDKDAFSNSFAVANILAENLSKSLEQYNLEVVINPILDSDGFWDLVAKYENRITQIQFNLIRPNMANISGTFKDEIRQLTDSTNSLITKVELNAPKDSTFENISPNNDKVKALADYSIQGGGEAIHLRVQGIRNIVKTEKAIRTQKIDEIEITGSSEKVINLYKEITGIT